MFELFQDVFQIRTPADALVAFIDITIVSYLIYRVLLLIRGTKAVPILFGLLLIIVGFFVSKDEYFGFSALNWVLDKFIAAFILLVIVIFQDDIRRGLAEVGRSRLFKGVSKAEETHNIEEIVKACVMLSSAKIGALIAVQKEGNLSQHAEEGIKIDGRLSHELLYSIFNPDNANPTHDGAVIIQNGRISAAGCFLQLTSNPRISKKLGTRHRAGIGLSEDTDAVICIVSEETGGISVVFESVLTRVRDANELRESLQRQLAIKKKSAPKREATRTLFQTFRQALLPGPQKGGRE